VNYPLGPDEVNVEGLSLTNLLPIGVGLHPKRALHLFRQLVAIMEQAWAKEIVHGSINPVNILVTTADQVKLHLNGDEARNLPTQGLTATRAQQFTMVTEPAPATALFHLSPRDHRPVSLLPMSLCSPLPTILVRAASCLGHLRGGADTTKQCPSSL
jgi:serine/threonine protein kinase